MRSCKVDELITQKLGIGRGAVRCIAWLGLGGGRGQRVAARRENCQYDCHDEERWHIAHQVAMILVRLE